MIQQRTKSVISMVLSLTLIAASLFSINAQAAVISTESAINQNTHTAAYDREKLLQALDQEGVRDQLLALGVAPDIVEKRIQSMTSAELAQLNAELDQLPAGEGVVGLVVLIFIVFVITDALCATDIFPFVNCVN